MKCLDTDFIIDFLNGSQKTIEKMQSLEEEGEIIVTSVINVLELFVGIVAVDGIVSKRIQKTRQFINTIEIHPINKNNAAQIAYILNTLDKKRTKNRFKRFNDCWNCIRI